MAATAIQKKATYSLTVVPKQPPISWEAFERKYLTREDFSNMNGSMV